MRDVNDSRRIESGSEAPKKTKKYAYADVLSFLRPVVKKKEVSTQRKTINNIYNLKIVCIKLSGTFFINSIFSINNICNTLIHIFTTLWTRKTQFLDITIL